jgi:hypothetical protein
MQKSRFLAQVRFVRRQLLEGLCHLAARDGRAADTMTSDICGHLFPRNDNGTELAEAERVLFGTPGDIKIAKGERGRRVKKIAFPTIGPPSRASGAMLLMSAHW